MQALVEPTDAPKYLKRALVVNNVLELGKTLPLAFDLSKFWSRNAHLAKDGQLSLAIPKGFWSSDPMEYFYLGTGNLREKNPNVSDHRRDEDFTELFEGTEFLRPTWQALEDHFDLQLYRPVLRLQSPKTCLSYHVDATPFRLHVVVHTHVKAMFVVNDQVKRMPREGYAYLLRTDVLHTSINADMHLPRVHLTFSGNFKN